MHCICDIKVIMVTGCQCGAFKWEKENKELFLLPLPPELGQTVRIHWDESLGSDYGGVDDMTWFYIAKGDYIVQEIDVGNQKVKIDDKNMGEVWIPIDILEVLG